MVDGNCPIIIRSVGGYEYDRLKNKLPVGEMMVMLLTRLKWPKARVGFGLSKIFTTNYAPIPVGDFLPKIRSSSKSGL